MATPEEAVPPGPEQSDPEAESPSPTPGEPRRRRRGRGGKGSPHEAAPPEAAAAPPERQRGRAAPEAPPEADEAEPEPPEPSGRALPPLAATAPTSGTLRWEEEEQAYLFSAGPVAYRVSVGPGSGGRGLLVVDGRVDEGDWTRLLDRAGMLYRAADGSVIPPDVAVERGEVVEFRHSARGRILTLRYTERYDDHTLRRTVTLRLLGRALTLGVTAPGTAGSRNYAGFTLGEPVPEEGRRIEFPGALDPRYVLDRGGFFSASIERSASAASANPEGAAVYLPNTVGRIHPIAELFYLTLAGDPMECLAALPDERSPFFEDTARRLVLDLFSEFPYPTDAELFRRLGRYGCRDLLVLYRNWQQFGYRRRSPALYPANPERGSNEAFRRLVETATGQGWRIALREEYASISPDSPYWDPKVVARESDGQPRRAPDGAFVLAADRMLDFARLECTQIQRNYRTNACYADGHVGWSPEEGLRQVDLEAGSRFVGTVAGVTRATEGLLRFLRDVHGGPLLGTGGDSGARFDLVWAGLADAVERPVAGGAGAPLAADYELRHANPVLPGFGVGVYPRFWDSPDELDPESLNWDLYRATEIALGRIGYLGAYGLRNSSPLGWKPLGSMARAVSEYFLLRGLQERSLASPVVEVGYRAGGDLIPLPEALHRGLDLANAQIYRRHRSGLEVWVNRDQRANWNVRTAAGALYDLPSNGWLATLPNGKFLAYSARIAGHRTDVCVCPEYRFLNTRSEVARRIEGITTDGIAVLMEGALSAQPDVVLVGSRVCDTGIIKYRLAERGDLSVRHLSPEEVEIAVLDTESGKPVQVSLPLLSPAWQTGALQLAEEANGEWGRPTAHLQRTEQAIQLMRARAGGVYRLSIEAEPASAPRQKPWDGRAGTGRRRR